jgi:hypothetical protein
VSSAKPDHAWFEIIGWLAGDRLLVQREDGLGVVAGDRSIQQLLPARLGAGSIASVSISPAGDALAFSVNSQAASDIYVASARSPANPVRLTHDGHAVAPLYGPRGIAYTHLGGGSQSSSDEADIWFLSAGATRAYRLTRTGAGLTPAAFDATGDRLLAANPARHNGRLWAVEMGSGRARPLTRWLGDLFPQGLSRDGQTVLASIGCGGTMSPYGVVETLPFAGGPAHLIARGPCRATWTR